MSTPKTSRIRCPECGLPVPDVPEDASYEETLCCECYRTAEEKLHKAVNDVDFDGSAMYHHD